jgi:hypothetical protein
MPLHVAREKALEAIHLIQQGMDPNTSREISVHTLGEQWRTY